MSASKRLKYTVLFIMMGFNIMLALFSIKSYEPVANRVPYQDSLNTFNNRTETFKVDSIKCGWNTTSILPPFKVDLMGYKPRGEYVNVNDTPTVKTLLIEAGSVTVAIISYDLMMTPPKVALKLKKELKDKGIIPYLTATHSHSSFGNWLKGGPVATLTSGKYKEEVVDYIVSQTIQSIKRAQRDLELSQITYLNASGEGLIQNRIADELAVGDSTIRGFEIQTASGRKGIWCSFAAHPTIITGDTLNITGDYPTILCNKLIKDGGYGFASFSAGMVGSHKAKYKTWSTNSGVCRNLYGTDLYNQITNTKTIDSINIEEIASGTCGLPLGEEELVLFGPIKLRPWAFRLFVGNPQKSASITYLRIGDISLVGLPCDYSASLYSFEKDDKVILTSFNGGYIGYVTHDEIQAYGHQESTFMSWYGPQFGAYASALVNKIAK